MKVQNLIKDLNKKNEIKLNGRQIEVLEEIGQFLKKEVFNDSVLNLFRKKKNGAYLFGPAGRGKTLITSSLNKYLTNKISAHIHFNDLIFGLQKLNFSSKEIKKKLLSKNIFFKKQKILFIDELDINNVADIIILKKFMNEAKSSKIKLIFTSNKSPENLYKDNHHKLTIKKLTKKFTSNFHIIELKTRFDYRKKVSNLSKFLFNKGKNTNYKNMNLLKIKIVGKTKGENKKINRLGNSFFISKIYNDLLECKFDTICGENYSFRDYKAILEKINYIFIKDVPQLNRSINDKIKRFIYLIDAIYENKKILSISTIIPFENIYIKEKNEVDFTRAYSRLNEIFSEKYIIDNLPKKYKL